MKYIADLHTHSIVSGHAYSTINENILEAKNKELKIIGLSEHAPMMPGSCHYFYFYNMKVIPEYIEGIKILKGVEANIIDRDGTIDMKEQEFMNLDYSIASLHNVCYSFDSIEDNTNAIVNAMKNKFVNIIGHPDDSRLPLDYQIIFENAKKYDKVIEINNSSLHEKSFRENSRENILTLLKGCMDYKIDILLGSDAHISYEVGGFEKCDELINLVNFPREQILNLDEEKIMNKIKIK